MSEEVISKSKQKREARKEEAKQVKKQRTLDSILGWIIGIVIAAAIVAVIIAGIFSSTTTTVANNDYSEGLTADGFVKGAKLDKVKDLNLNNLTVALSDVDFTDEDVEKAIESVLTNFKYFDDSKKLEVKDGDTINLDYVGSVNDIPFEGGDTKGKGATLVIGSHSYIDTFEEQLIGAHPGDKVTVNVTFPDPYTSNPDLAGKAAKFECTINGIETTPLFTDAFVSENLSEYASTTEEYRAYVKETGYNNNLQNYLSSYIFENAEVKSIPKAYLNNTKALIKYNDIQTYNYYNQYYYSMLGSYIYNSFSDFTQMTDAEYEADLTEQATKQTAANITFEKYFKDNNLSISDDTYAMVLEAYGENAEATYGKSYLLQVASKYEVIKHLTDVVKVQ